MGATGPSLLGTGEVQIRTVKVSTPHTRNRNPREHLPYLRLSVSDHIPPQRLELPNLRSPPYSGILEQMISLPQTEEQPR
jgi:hypothetical protein